MAGVARAGGRGPDYVRPRRPGWQGGSVEVRHSEVETSFGGKQVDGLNVVNERKEHISIASLT